jgi:hypothetical protein
MPYLIQGLFFQNRQWLGLGYKPADGVVAVIRNGLCQFMYAGAIWQDPAHVMGGLTGHMLDTFGNSILSDIYIDDGVIRFKKKYDSRPDTIQYVFEKKDGNSWVGEYTGSAVGKGISRCVLTEVSDEFFLPDSIMTLLGKGSAHAWPKQEA